MNRIERVKVWLMAKFLGIKMVKRWEPPHRLPPRSDWGWRPVAPPPSDISPPAPPPDRFLRESELPPRSRPRFVVEDGAAYLVPPYDARIDEMSVDALREDLKQAVRLVWGAKNFDDNLHADFPGMAQAYEDMVLMRDLFLSRYRG